MRVIDMHCDTVSKLRTMGKKQNLNKNELCVDLERLQESGTWIQYFACFTDAVKYSTGKEYGEKFSSEVWEKAWKEVIMLLDSLKGEESEQFQVFHIRKEAEQCKHIVYGLATVEEGGVLNGKMERLEQLYKRDVRLITLTWNYENCIGYPNSRERSVMERGLKPFGINVIEQMNERKMLIDVSHLSDGGFWDCIQHSKVPVIASHSNARALCQHPRNLSDEMLRALSEKGGVAGLNFYPFFLKTDGQVIVADIARHAKYMIKTAGEDVVALGTDFDGFETDIQEGYISHVGQMELVWEACKAAGITERQLDKICWKNAWRVMKDVLK